MCIEHTAYNKHRVQVGFVYLMTSVFGRLSVAAVTPFDAYVNAVTPQNIDSASFVATITHAILAHSNAA